MQARARAWAFRCTLELQQHRSATFTTLTYDDKHLPPTLSKRDLQLFLKRARKSLGKDRPVRFFACGEYGEVNHRPHYHAILYGLSERDRDLVESAWGKGRTQTVPAGPASIAYTAGYCAKKIGWRSASLGETVDMRTGEIFIHQPPFTQMSRRPGIGGHARQWANSWRLFAVSNGTKLAVPRFLHEAWKQQATPLDMEDLLFEKANLAASRDTSVERLKAAEAIAVSRQSLQGSRRSL